MFKDDFYKNSFLLTCSNLTTGIIKFIFSIILSLKLGAQGMGLYSLIMPIYDFFAVIVCGGMITAVSKESASYYSKKDYGNLHKSISVSLVFDLLWSILISIFIFEFSPYICKNIIKDSRAMYSLWLVSISIIFVALSAILKGYFYGISKVVTPSIIDILEKTVRMVTIITLINVLNLNEITKTVTITYFSLTLGEITSFLLLFYFYRKTKIKYNNNYSKCEKSLQLLLNILIISFPLCVNGVLTTGIYTASTLLLPQRLVIAGFSHSKALAEIGKFSGMAFTIVMFPFIAISSLNTVLVPDISQNVSHENYSAIYNRIFQVICISFILGLSILVICFSIPNNLGQLFFKRQDLGPYIKAAALSAPFSFVSATTFGILNGLGKQKIVLKNSIISAVEELILMYILASIPSINIYGYAISIIITEITTLSLNLVEINKRYSLKFSKAKITIDILTAILVYFCLTILNSCFQTKYFILKNIILIFIGFVIFIFVSLQSNTKST